MKSLTLQKSNAKILYLTDKMGVSDGYNKAFNLMLANAGLRRQQLIITHIYGLVKDALVKKGNRKAPGFNADKIDEITAAFDQRVSAVQPDIIVCSCPAVLGLFVDWNWSLATLDKLRGGVYDYRGIPVVITFPITAIHSHVDERALRSADDDDLVKSEPYRVKHGQWILNRDWEKVGRIAHKRQITFPPFEYAVIRTLEDALAAKAWLNDSSVISTDIETGCYPAQITCVGFTGLKSSGACRSFVFPFYDPFNANVPGSFWDSESDHEIIWSIVRGILNNPVPKIMHNGLYDSHYFIKYRLGAKNYLIDSMYLWWSIYMELPKTLDFVSSILLDDFQYWKDDIKGIENESVGGQGMEQYWRYNAVDCRNTLWCAMRLLRVMAGSEMAQKNYRDAWMRLASGLSMSMRGIKADKKRFAEHRRTVEDELETAINRFRFIIDDPNFNINSPVQRQQLFYGILGARERTDRGRYVTKESDKASTNKTALKMVKTDHPYFKWIVNQYEKAADPSAQLSKVFGRNSEDGKVIGGLKMFTSRLRTSYNPVGTTTTRFSSKESNFWDGGNVQNIREKYRDWLVADDGCILMDVDYSQSDDVFMGYEANDRAKIAVIESGVDGHAVHGELFFKVPYDQIITGKKSNDPWITHPVNGIRQISKRIVHGTNFQMAAMTLYASQMGRDATVTAARLLIQSGMLKVDSDPDSWTQDRLVKVCELLMAQYRKKYPRFTRKEYYAEILQALRTRGTITNCFDIERRFLGDPNDNGTQREATGFIGQSATAGNMNRVQYEIDHGWIPKRFRDGINPDARDRPRQMDWHSHGFQFLLQVHDSFIVQLDTRNANWKEAASNLLHVMNRPIIINGHTVRVRTEAAFGRAWSKETMIEWKSKDAHDLDRIAIN